MLDLLLYDYVRPLYDVRYSKRGIQIASFEEASGSEDLHEVHKLEAVINVRSQITAFQSVFVREPVALLINWVDQKHPHRVITGTISYIISRLLLECDQAFR